MLMDVIEALMPDSLVAIYYEQSDVLLWRDFINAEAQKRFDAPKLVKIDRATAEYEIT